MKTVLAILAFIVLYVAAGTIGAAMPWWVGVALLLAPVAFIVVLLVKIGRSF